MIIGGAAVTGQGSGSWSRNGSAAGGRDRERSGGVSSRNGHFGHDQVAIFGVGVGANGCHAGHHSRCNLPGRQICGDRIGAADVLQRPPGRQVGFGDGVVADQSSHIGSAVADRRIDGDGAIERRRPTTDGERKSIVTAFGCLHDLQGAFRLIVDRDFDCVCAGRNRDIEAAVDGRRAHRIMVRNRRGQVPSGTAEHCYENRHIACRQTPTGRKSHFADSVVAESRKTLEWRTGYRAQRS